MKGQTGRNKKTTEVKHNTKKKKKKKKKTKHTHVTSGVQVCCHATLRNRDVPTAHPHARICRRRKGAKGNKRYAAACKRKERKYVTMSCHVANRGVAWVRTHK